jgi:hypothetical protein
VKKLVAVLTLLTFSIALAEDDKPMIYVLEPGTVTLKLESRSFLFPEEAFTQLDKEVVRLQKHELVCNAERADLRKTVEAMPDRPEVKHVVIAAMVGLAVGAGATAFVLTRK